MICARCLRRASQARLVSSMPSQSLRISTGATRFLSSTPSLLEKQPLSANTAQTSQPQREIPAATSTAAAQPFSERDTPSPENAGTPTAPDQPAKARPNSSVPGGTPLHGLNYFKNQEDPIAMEDDEYPDWLWDVLSEKKKFVVGAQQEKDPRLYSKSVNTRRKANKRERKQAMLQSDQPEEPVPIFEQSVNLAPNATAREDLTKAMREKRRRDIKEANFLKAMR